MITDDEPRSIREINPDIPEWLCLLISRLMAKSPDARFGNALEVATLLEQCLAHVQQPTSVPLSASLVTHAAGRRSIFTVTRKGVLAMLGTIGMTLLGMVLWKATEAPDISGQWTSDEWGTVVLEAKQPGQYEGTFTGKSGAVDPKFHGKLQSLKTGDGIAQFHIPDVDLTDVLDKSKSGTLRVKWSRVERRFNGTWGSSNDRTKVTVTPEGAIIGYKDTRGSGADRSAKISLRLVDKEIRGGWTTDEGAQLESGTPLLGDLLWTRNASKTQAAESPGVSIGLQHDRLIQRLQGRWQVVRVVDPEGADSRLRSEPDVVHHIGSKGDRRRYAGTSCLQLRGDRYGR